MSVYLLLVNRIRLYSLHLYYGSIFTNKDGIRLYRVCVHCSDINNTRIHLQFSSSYWIYRAIFVWKMLVRYISLIYFTSVLIGVQLFFDSTWLNDGRVHICGQQSHIFIHVCERIE